LLFPPSFPAVIDRWLATEKIGHRLVREMTREHISRMVAARADTPGAANSLLQKIKVLLRFAIEHGLRADDPSLRLRKFKKGEFHTWTEDEIAQYEAKWPFGTTARLAFALLLFTGQRRSDVVTMARSDVAEGMIQVQPLKTKRTTGTRLWIPIHPNLATVLANTSLGQTMLLETAFKKPFAAAGFGNYMADRIGEAGLPDRCVTHGLRKAAARRLAEAGCSANEIQAITGHATLQEVSRYTKAAEQKKLAKKAMKRLARTS
jgi:integrase